jgi:hypothetical protein
MHGEQFRADMQAGFDQLSRGEGRAYDKISGRKLAEQVKRAGERVAPRRRSSDCWSSSLGWVAFDLSSAPTSAHHG